MFEQELAAVGIVIVDLPCAAKHDVQRLRQDNAVAVAEEARLARTPIVLKRLPLPTGQLRMNSEARGRARVNLLRNPVDGRRRRVQLSPWNKRNDELCPRPVSDFISRSSM